MFNRFILAGALALGLLGASVPAVAQISYGVRVCNPSYPTQCIKPDTGGATPVSGFGPSGQTNAISVTSSSAATALPSTGATAVVQNTGSTTIYVLLGGSSVSVTTSTGYPISAGATASFSVGTNTYIAAVTASSTSTMSVATGSGTPGGGGGGGSGGGGGGAVTIADGADVTQGAIGDTAYTGSGTSTVTAALKAIANSVLSATPTATNITQIGGTSIVTGGISGSQGVGGVAANGATVSGNPLMEGCRAATAAPTAVTDGQAAYAQCGAEGARVTRPYAIKESMVRGSTGATTSATQVSIIGAGAGSLKNYITAIQCANSGSTTSILTFTDANATVLINPTGGGGSWTFPIPLVTAAATAFQVTFGSASTSQYCSAQGYTGL